MQTLLLLNIFLIFVVFLGEALPKPNTTTTGLFQSKSLSKGNAILQHLQHQSLDGDNADSDELKEMAEMDTGDYPLDTGNSTNLQDLVNDSRELGEFLNSLEEYRQQEAMDALDDVDSKQRV